MAGKILSGRDEGPNLQVVLHSMALIPDEEEARAYILENFDLSLTNNYMKWIKRHHAEKFQEARDAVAQANEKRLSSDLMDTAAMANEVKGMALQRTKEALEKNQVRDPSRVARDIADVEAKAIDKSRLLADKPTQIVAKRNIDDDIRFLEQKGIIPKQIEVTIESDTDDHPEDAETTQERRGTSAS